MRYINSWRRDEKKVAVDMKKAKIALKPYLDTIAGYCSTLSNQELIEIIINLAKDVSTSDRAKFLEKIESSLPDRRPAAVPEADPVEQILDDIGALKENIEERINSIEDGSYWDDPDDWQDDRYYDEEPDYISQDQVEDLGSFLPAWNKVLAKKETNPNDFQSMTAWVYLFTVRSLRD